MITRHPYRSERVASSASLGVATVPALECVLPAEPGAAQLLATLVAVGLAGREVYCEVPGGADDASLLADLDADRRALHHSGRGRGRQDLQAPGRQAIERRRDRSGPLLLPGHVRDHHDHEIELEAAAQAPDAPECDPMK